MKKTYAKKTAVILMTCLALNSVFYNPVKVKAYSMDDFLNGAVSNSDSAVKDYNSSITNGTNSASSVEDGINNFIDSIGGNDKDSSTTNESATGDTTTPKETPVLTIKSVVKNVKTGNSQIQLYDATATTPNVYLNKALSIDVSNVLGSNNSNVSTSYVLIKDGNTLTDKTKWTNVSGNTINITTEGKGTLYLKVSSGENDLIVKTNNFTLDKTKPSIKGATSDKVYSTAKTITFSDSLSGIKKVTLNGKSVSTKKSLNVTKKGTYTVTVTDNSNNASTIKFKIK